MREYETTLIIQPEISDEGVGTLQERLDGTLEGFGTIRLIYDDLGKRRLAYEIQNFQKGRYVMLRFLDEGSNIKALERALGLEDSIIRFLTVQVNDAVEDIAARQAEAAEEERIRAEKAAERAAREAEEAERQKVEEAERQKTEAEEAEKRAAAAAEAEAAAAAAADGESEATADAEPKAAADAEPEATAEKDESTEPVAAATEADAADAASAEEVAR
ncbi:MAG: 30S ribosomal protein S6 [Deltaproteobacteria bacterium]|nr:30S ribosomal protein S6 [Deltaproteobacteria bacterium]